MPPRSASSASSASRQVGHRGRGHHLRLGVCGVGFLLAPEQRQLPVLGLAVGAQLAPQVAQREVGEVEAALPRPGEVGRERGVAGEPGERPAAPAQGVQRRLGVVGRLRDGRVGEPLPQGGLVVGGEPGDVEVARLRHTRGGACGTGLDRGLTDGETDPGQIGGGDPATDAGERDPDPAAVAGVGVEPGPHRARLDRAALHLDAALGLGLGALQRGEQPLAQHPELQLVEQPMHGVAVPWPNGEVDGTGVERDIPDQLGELAVEQHTGEVGAQRVARLALDLVDTVGEVGERAELAHPLGRGLLPHARDARQVVARVAAQGREIGVLRRGEAVAVHHLARVDPGEVGDAALRVQHRDVVADQLERVAVAGADEHLEPLGLCLGGQRGDEVVGLVALDPEVGDVQRPQHLLDEVHLAAEVVGRGRAIGLVLGVALAAERGPRDVEAHREVGGLLVAQHVDQHRREAVDRVGGLPGAGAEVLRGQREERAVGQRVAVEQQQPPPR